MRARPADWFLWRWRRDWRVAVPRAAELLRPSCGQYRSHGAGESGASLTVRRDSMSPSIAESPELAGVATYGEASRMGFSVDDNGRRLMPFPWGERGREGVLLGQLTERPGW